MTTVTISLPDGSSLDVEQGTTVEGVAYEIGTGLGDDCLAGRVDGDLVDRRYRLEDDATLAVVTPSSDDGERVARRTAALVLGCAVERLFPDAVPASIGVEEAEFYHDFDGFSADTDDLATIRATMDDLVDADVAIERRVPDESLADRADSRYERELLEVWADAHARPAVYDVDGTTFVTVGPFFDRTGDLDAFDLLEVSAAYWRGDEDDEMLTRIHGTAFQRESDLQAYLNRREEVEARDHRKLNRELNLFSVPDHSPGCPHFHPNGMAIRRELEEYVRELNDRLGYDEVWTPHLNKSDIWRRTGHYEEFIENGQAFLWEDDGEQYGPKPVNCPNHMYLYERDHRSYRDLPIRYFENQNIHRNEQSGELSGLFRLQAFTQDDGHAFLRPDQVHREVARVLGVVREIPERLGMEPHFELQINPANAAGTDEQFEQASQQLREVLESEGWDYSTVEGKGAFYAPKVDMVATDEVGQEWVLGGVQLDHVLPEKFGLTYVDEDGEERRPVVLHRILIGSFERFFAAIVEHFGGDMPLWLAPEQVRVLPISDESLDYAREVAADLGEFRVEVEDRPWTLEKKIRRAHEHRIPYMLVVGSDEAEAGTVSVRDRNEREWGPVELGEFRDRLERERDERALEPSA